MIVWLVKCGILNDSLLKIKSSSSLAEILIKDREDMCQVSLVISLRSEVKHQMALILKSSFCLF